MDDERMAAWVAWMKETRAWNLERLGLPPGTPGADQPCSQEAWRQAALSRLS